MKDWKGGVAFKKAKIAEPGVVELTFVSRDLPPDAPSGALHGKGDMVTHKLADGAIKVYTAGVVVQDEAELVSVLYRQAGATDVSQEVEFTLRCALDIEDPADLELVKAMVNHSLDGDLEIFDRQGDLFRTRRLRDIGREMKDAGLTVTKGSAADPVH